MAHPGNAGARSYGVKAVPRRKLALSGHNPALVAGGEIEEPLIDASGS
ncbi:hypothetical protein [Gluconobacter cerinus]|nr:hypothetical protein [Gluconobacter cerinus]MBS1036109.1 hypothetical protein [Gluconobacter cerinus]